MSMTHMPEIGVVNPYPKTGTINGHKNRVCPIRYPKLIPEKFSTKLHVRHIRNWYLFSGAIFGTDFW